MSLYYLAAMSVALILLIILPLVVIVRFFFSRKERDRLTGQELDELEESVERLISKLQSTAKHSEEVINNKIIELKELLEKADSKMVKTDENVQKKGSVAANNVADTNYAEQEDSRNKIIEMARKGIKPELIAKEVNMHTGEVQLILGLGKIGKAKNPSYQRKIDNIVN